MKLRSPPPKKNPQFFYGRSPPTKISFLQSIQNCSECKAAKEKQGSS